MFNKHSNSEELLELVKNVGAVNQQLANVQSTIEKLDKKIDELGKQGEEVLAIRLRQEQLEQTMIDIKNKNIDLELRVNTLEDADGKKAKSILTKVGNYVLAALVGAILFNIRAIIESIGGK